MPITFLSYSPKEGWTKKPEAYKPVDLPTNLPETYQVAEVKKDYDGIPIAKKDQEGNNLVDGDGNIQYEYEYTTYPDETAINTNKLNAVKNEDNKKFNDKLAKKDAVYQEVLNIATNAKGGDYLAQKAAIQNLDNKASEVGLKVDELLKEYNAFYKTEKIGAGWNIDLGAKPPAGNFDADYYLAQNPEIKDTWESAQKNGDLDILEQYKKPAVLALYYYTAFGKKAGKRGNKEEELLAAKEYLEKKPTDSDIAGIKDKQLGISYDPVKEAKPGTQLEEAVSEALGADILSKTKQFGALTQDVLKNTINEMKKAKAKEQTLSMVSGLSDFEDVFNINQALSDSILGDSGVGGILAFGGSQGSKAKEGLEKALQKMTGVNTSTTYNWQQWFDSSLKKQYEQDIELGLTKEKAEEKIKVEADFAKKFIEQYLIPRFNESKTVSEFMEYVNVKDEEQNPFQTQDMVNAAVDAGSSKSTAYLNQLKQLQDVYFDPKFYYDPTVNLKSEQVKSLTGVKQQQTDYKLQAKTVAEDWEEAKKQVNAQDGYWFEQAYKYGVDIENKDAFAKLHYQVKGLSKGFDGAEDIWTPAKVKDYIYATILPAIKGETDKMTVFGNFVKPDDFSDALLESYNVKPDDKSTWGKVLDTFKLNEFKGSYDELKGYIADTFKTVSASETQAKLKELKKKGIKPTQKNLGVFYIEKPTDTAGTPEGETALYKTFKGAGYGGSEEEFYKKFFPDLDFQEQKLLTQAGKKKGGLEFIKFDTKDPFEALGTIEKLTGGDKGEFSNIFAMPTLDEEKATKKSFFNIGLDDDDDDENKKAKTGDAILGEFTSFLKGF